jgi:RND superfamily putative drug exporter
LGPGPPVTSIDNKTTYERLEMLTLTRWVLNHKRTVVGLWLALTVVAFAAMKPASDALSQEFPLPGQEAYEVNHQIVENHGSGGDAAPLVPVVTVPAGQQVDRRQFAAALKRLEQAVPGSRVTQNPTFTSRDRRTAFALVDIPNKGGTTPGQAEARDAQAAVEDILVNGSPVRVTGLDALRASAGENEKGGAGVLIEVLLAGLGALLVLTLVFRSFMAFVPVLMAIVAIPTTFLLIWPVAAVTDVSMIVQFLVALIGLGIAIDYALLVVVRWREERQRANVDDNEAVRNAMQHAGSAVVFSGTTVAISLMALVALPVPVLRSIGIAGLMIALVSVAVAITLLPVALATVGPRLDRHHARRKERASHAWTAWARMIVRHRALAAVTATAALGALVVAAATIQLGSPQAESLGQGGAARAGLEQLKESGIGTGALSPFQALVERSDSATVAGQLARVEGVRSAVVVDERLVTVIPAGDGNSAAGRETLKRLREASETPIGGEAAQSADFIDAVYGNFPLLIASIAGLTFLLLARAFRSLVLPLKAVLLNILSVAAAWGLMVIVFQHGWGSEQVWGIEATQAINVEMPVVVFAFLFGVSMDYQVFIISRMREAYDRTGDTNTAIIESVGRTGRLVTSAALILGLAFVAFSATPGTEAKMFATALGGGILIDATIIRGILAPAAVALLGRWNWWMPTRAARLLRLEPAANAA